MENNAEKAKKIVGNLLNREKIALLSGKDFWHTQCVNGAKSITLSDGPHGLRKVVKESAEPGDIGTAIETTCFPTAVNVASTFNTGLANELGAMLGDICRAEGVSVLLGPGLNIKRSPLSGRNFEYYSEDPLLSGEMAAEYVKGVESRGVGACIKHFAANNQEYRRNVISSDVDMRTLREIYLSAFEYTVKNASPRAVMCAYNKLNGVYCSENKFLLREILREEWGFDGAVISDWGAVLDRARSLAGGVDLEMPPHREYSMKRVKDALESGAIEEKDIDEAAHRVIALALDTAPEITPPVDKTKAHEFALKLAHESMVLLKNENGILPLDKNKRIAFIGEFAEKPRYQGGGSSHVNTNGVISPLEAARKKTNICYAKGYEINVERSVDEDLLVEAIELAGKADAAVLFVGLPDRIESEGYDREYLELPYNQMSLIREVSKVQNNLVVVLFNGAPVAMPWINCVSGILEAYLAGEAVGEAVTDILFGDVNPSGKLAETFPKDIADTPCFRYFNRGKSAEYREGIYVGYRYYDKSGVEPLFPFGYGLSYTEFEYSDLKITRKDDKIVARVKVKNTGKAAGKEAVQIYVAPPQDSDVFMPVKTLAAFKKAELAPGEEAELTFDIPMRAFSYYNVIEKRFVTLGGDYAIMACASAKDIRLSESLTIEGERVRTPYAKDKLPSYFSGKVDTVSDAEFKELYGGEIARDDNNETRKFGLTNCLEDTRATVWGRRIYKLINRAMADRGAADGSSDMFTKTFSAIPFIVMPPLTDNVVDIKTVEALLDLINGRQTIRAKFRLIKSAINIGRRFKRKEKGGGNPASAPQVKKCCDDNEAKR